MGIMPRNGILALALLTCADAQPAAELRFSCARGSENLRSAARNGRGFRDDSLSHRRRADPVQPPNTQQLEPELATSWKVFDQGRRIDFVLRHNVSFSDGVPFGAADVVATMQRMMTPGLQSGIADSFPRRGEIRAQANGVNEVSVFFSTPVAGLEMTVRSARDFARTAWYRRKAQCSVRSCSRSTRAASTCC